MEDEKEKNIKKFNWTKIKKEELSSDFVEEGSKGVYNPVRHNEKHDSSKIKQDSVDLNKSNTVEKPQEPKKFIDQIKKNVKEEIEAEGLEICKSALNLKKPAPTICYVCGKEITKQKKYSFFYRERINVCIPCYYNYPKCDNCGMIVKQSVSGLGVHYCQFCRLNKQCISCGNTFHNKELVRIKNVKGLYCKNCLDTITPCFNCGQLLNPEYSSMIQLPDRRISCKLCFDRLIKDKTQTKFLLTKLTRIISANTGINIKINTEINDYVFFDKSIFAYEEDNRIFISYNCPEEKAVLFLGKLIGKQTINQLNQKLSDSKCIEAFQNWLTNFILKEMEYIEFVNDNFTNDSVIKKYYKSFLNIENTSGAKKVFDKIKTV